jgi:hypothetical protein
VDDSGHSPNDKIVADCADAAVAIHPGKFFHKYFDQSLDDGCVVKETYMKNIFALGSTNTIAIRFHTKRTNKAWVALENTGITALKIKGGEVIELPVFYFDADTLQKMWGE